MEEISESTKIALIIFLWVISLFIPLGFILLFGPQRFEKKEKR